MFEVERYELESGPAYRFAPDRRDFVKLLGGGIVVLLALGGDAEGQESGRRGRGGNAMPQDLGAWLHIGEDSAVTVYTGKVEVGQNARTALTQAVSEELGVPPSAVKLIMGDTALVPYDMGTFGSMTTPQMAPQMRRVGAAARAMLLDFAAEQWKVDRGSVQIADGRVRCGSRSAAFGELTKGKNLLTTVAQAEVHQPLGQSIPKVNGRDIVTGAHRYSTDVKRPGMLFGKVLRPPSFGAKLGATSANMPAGVQFVRDGEFAGLVAPDSLAAQRALDMVKAEWTPAPHPASKDLFAYLKANPEGGNGRPGGPKGSIEEGLKTAAHKLDVSYTIAYIAHVPLEPRAAVAEWQGDRLTVWTGTQRPFGVRSELAQAFSIPETQVRVMVPDTGSGYGGKHTGECAIEAARLAKAAGKPVKLVWTREEEFMWAYARPAGVIDVKAGVSKDGLLTAWEFHNYNSGGSGIETLYEVANKHIEFHRTKSPLKQGSYRGLAATANHFVRESAMDELAHAAGIDPLDFRLKNLKDARMRAVLEAAAERGGWGKRKGLGLACGFEKGAYVGSCVEVSSAGKIERVVTTFECGAIVNPDHLKNQVEGAVVMGLGGALFEAMEFEGGRLLNGRLSRYRVPRFSDVPALETVLLDRKDLKPSGAGETPIIALAPAIGNALFALTGERLRCMPMRPDKAAS